MECNGKLGAGICWLLLTSVSSKWRENDLVVCLVLCVCIFHWSLCKSKIIMQLWIICICSLSFVRKSADINLLCIVILHLIHFLCIIILWVSWDTDTLLDIIKYWYVTEICFGCSRDAKTRQELMLGTAQEQGAWYFSSLVITFFFFSSLSSFLPSSVSLD